MYKVSFGLLLMCILLTTIIAEAKHIVHIENKSNKKARAILSVPNYYKVSSLKEIPVNSKSSVSLNLDSKDKKFSYTFLMDFANDSKELKNRFVRYYNFIDDTLNIIINEDSVSYVSSNGYDKELNYPRIYVKMELESNFLEFSEYLNSQEEYLNTKIDSIYGIGFKSQEFIDYLIEDIRFQIQWNMLDYLIDNSIKGDNNKFEVLSKIYEERADFDIINNPKYYRNINYNALMSRFIEYREHLADEIPLKAFRKKKQEDIINYKLGRFAKQIVEIKRLYSSFQLPMDKRNDADDILSMMKDIIDDSTYLPQIKKDLLRMLKLEFSIAEGNKFPISEFEGLDGKTVRMSDYIGNVVVVCVYSSHCPGSVKSLPILHEVKENIGNDNLRFIFVNCDKRREDWEQGIKKYNIADDINIHVGGGFIGLDKYSKKLNIHSIPYIIIVDAEGNNYEYHCYIHRQKIFETKLKILLLESAVNNL